mmetsp:Transcript_1349/g.3484  ORF Transcript_1349/g.3484 Transcript_1349/m.3484 type:complete len:203 (+) Transcript_1349:815-1423(+)
MAVSAQSSSEGAIASPCREITGSSNRRPLRSTTMWRDSDAVARTSHDGFGMRAVPSTFARVAMQRAEPSRATSSSSSPRQNASCQRPAAEASVAARHSGADSAHGSSRRSSAGLEPTATGSRPERYACSYQSDSMYDESRGSAASRASSAACSAGPSAASKAATAARVAARAGSVACSGRTARRYLRQVSTSAGTGRRGTRC